MVEMCAAMDELRHQNQTLEENVINIRQHHQETNPLEEMEILDPSPLSGKKIMGIAYP